MKLMDPLTGVALSPWTLFPCVATLLLQPCGDRAGSPRYLLTVSGVAWGFFGKTDALEVSSERTRFVRYRRLPVAASTTSTYAACRLGALTSTCQARIDPLVVGKTTRRTRIGAANGPGANTVRWSAPVAGCRTEGNREAPAGRRVAPGAERRVASWLGAAFASMSGNEDRSAATSARSAERAA